MSFNPNSYSAPKELTTVTPLPALPYITPESLGAKGDGVTEDTAAFNTAITLLNSGKVYSLILRNGANYLTAPLTSISAPNVSIFGNRATLLVKPNSWATTGDGSTHLNFTTGADNLLIQDLTIDGNQFAFGTPPAGRLLGVDHVDSPVLRNVSLVNSPSSATRWETVSNGRVSDCHFDQNANTGWERASCSYTVINSTTRNNNGWGFQVSSWANRQFAGFGEAARFQCFGETDIGGSACFNGQDGLNQNQGSHHNTFIGSICNGNGDGGFTIAADSTSPGRPGDGVSPYSLKYVGVEATANWASGLISFVPTDDCEISGRFSDNCRLAGNLTIPSAAMAGVFLSSGCTNFKLADPVDCFDDRQTCPITAVSGSGSTRVLTATGWTAGWSSLYKTVSFFNASGVCQGYGFITAESSGSVTVSASTTNPVTLASIATTWYVSQVTQTFGVFVDNACQGELQVTGYGHKANTSFSSALAYSGSFTNGQNIILPKRVESSLQLLVNGTFDADVTNWSYTLPGGATATQETTNTKSAGALKLTSVAGQTSQGFAAQIAGSLKATSSTFIEYSGWVYSDTPQDSAISIIWNTSFFSFVGHSGGGWQFLKIGAWINDANGVTTLVSASNGNTVYFDSMSLKSVSLANTPSNFARPAYLNSLATAPLYPVPPA